MRRIAVSLVLAAAASGIAACTAGTARPAPSKPSWPSGGPLESLDSAGHQVYVPWGFATTEASGGVLAVGLDPYYNVSGSDIRIVDVRPIVDRPGLTVIGVLVAGLTREEGGGGATYRQFPPSGLGDLSPAVGIVLPANTPRDGLGYNEVSGVT
jgi:hypothetical protein